MIELFCVFFAFIYERLDKKKHTNTY